MSERTKRRNIVMELLYFRSSQTRSNKSISTSHRNRIDLPALFSSIFSICIHTHTFHPFNFAAFFFFLFVVSCDSISVLIWKCNIKSMQQSLKLYSSVWWHFSTFSLFSFMKRRSQTEILSRQKCTDKFCLHFSCFQNEFHYWNFCF